MKKFLIVLLVLFMLAGVGGTVYFYYQYNTVSSEKEMLTYEVAGLQSELDAIGPITNVWTVSVATEAGQEIREDQLVQQAVPASTITENHILDKQKLIGNYYKVNMQPGTSFTKDLLITEAWDTITYERDLTFAFLPLGLKVGDYVDIRIVLPFGQEFVVIQHERVQQLVETSNTIKLLLDEAQIALWTSAMKDKALYGDMGVSLYVTKYVEPGITDEAVAFYPVRKEMESTVTLNVNIPNKKQCINSVLRTNIDNMLASVEVEQGSKLTSGVTSEASGVNMSKDSYVEEKHNYNNNGEVYDSSEVVDSYSQIVNLNPDDITGQSSVPQSQIDNANGGKLDVGETPIE